MNRSKALAYVAFATVCILWGTTYLGIAIAIETLPTFLFAGTRFTAAGVLLLVISLLAGQRLPEQASDWWNLLVIGLLLVGIGNLAVVWAEHYLPSSFAALLVALAPFWMALLESLRKDGERLTARKLTGLIIGFAGVAVLVAPALGSGKLNGPFLLGVAALQCGSVAWNLGSIRSKYHLSKSISPLIAASLQMIFGGAILSIIGLSRGEASRYAFNGRTLSAFLYLMIFGSVVAYGAYVYALSHLKTSLVSTYAYVNPIVAVILGWLVLHEPIGWNVLLAMMIIFSGVALVQTGGRQRIPVRGLPPIVEGAVTEPSMAGNDVSSVR